MRLYRVTLTKDDRFADLLVVADDPGDAKHRVVIALDIPGYRIHEPLLLDPEGDGHLMQVGGNVLVVGRQ